MEPTDPLVYLDRSTNIVYADAFKPRVLDFINYKPLKFDMTGLAYLAECWRTVSSDEKYRKNYDLNDDNLIDYQDLAIFADNWFW